MRILQIIAGQAKVEVLEAFEKRLKGSKKGVGHPEVATDINNEEFSYKANGPATDRNYDSTQHMKDNEKKRSKEPNKKRHPEEPNINEQIWLETHGYHSQNPEG